MSGRGSKLSRRDARKTLGETTVQLIEEIAAAIKVHIFPAIHAQEQRLQTLEAQMRRLSKPANPDPASKDGHY